MDVINGNQKIKCRKPSGSLLQSLVSDVELALVKLSRSIVGLVSVLFGSGDELANVDESVRKCIALLIEVSVMLQVPLHVLVHQKMKVNRVKYNAAICRGRRGIVKYTKDTGETGFIEVLAFREVVGAMGVFAVNDARVWFDTESPALIEEITCFARERGWTKAYTDRSLSLYLLEELGELAEAVNRLSSSRPLQSLPSESFDALCSEVADIAVYLLHTCREYNIDLKQKH